MILRIYGIQRIVNGPKARKNPGKPNIRFGVTIAENGTPEDVLRKLEDRRYKPPPSEENWSGEWCAWTHENLFYYPEAPDKTDDTVGFIGLPKSGLPGKMRFPDVRITRRMRDTIREVLDADPIVRGVRRELRNLYGSELPELQP